MDIRYLADHPGHVPALARWHHAQWGALYDDWTPDVAEEELRDHAARRDMPTTLIAVEGDELFGSVSLVEEDTPELRGHGDAWLASLYVRPEARGRGLGALLVRAVVAFAADQKVERLWLFTPEHEDFYARLGWHARESASLRGTPVRLMDIRPA